MKHFIEPNFASWSQIKRPFARRALRGMGLLDNVFSIGIFVLVLVLLLGLFSTIMQTWRSTNHTLLMARLTSGIQRAYATSPSYDTGNLVNVLDSGGDIPSSARVVTGGTVTIQNPYGGAVTVVGAGGRVILTTNAVPEKGCVTLTEPYVGRPAGTNGVRTIAINGSVAVQPVTRTWIATICTATNVIALTY